MPTVVYSYVMDIVFQIENNLCYSCDLLVVEMIQSNKIILILRFSLIFIPNDCFATVSFSYIFCPDVFSQVLSSTAYFHICWCRLKLVYRSP
jgi:hypothetical protein